MENQLMQKQGASLEQAEQLVQRAAHAARLRAVPVTVLDKAGTRFRQSGSLAVVPEVMLANPSELYNEIYHELHSPRQDYWLRKTISAPGKHVPEQMKFENVAVAATTTSATVGLVPHLAAQAAQFAGGVGGLAALTGLFGGPATAMPWLALAGLGTVLQYGTTIAQTIGSAAGVTGAYLLHPVVDTLSGALKDLAHADDRIRQANDLHRAADAIDTSALAKDVKAGRADNLLAAFDARYQMAGFPEGLAAYEAKNPTHTTPFHDPVAVMEQQILRAAHATMVQETKAARAA